MDLSCLLQDDWKCSRFKQKVLLLDYSTWTLPSSVHTLPSSKHFRDSLPSSTTMSLKSTTIMDLCAQVIGKFPFVRLHQSCKDMLRQNRQLALPVSHSLRCDRHHPYTHVTSLGPLVFSHDQTATRATESSYSRVIWLMLSSLFATYPTPPPVWLPRCWSRDSSLSSLSPNLLARRIKITLLKQRRRMSWLGGDND